MLVKEEKSILQQGWLKQAFSCIYLLHKESACAVVLCLKSVYAENMQYLVVLSIEAIDKTT